VWLTTAPAPYSTYFPRLPNTARGRP
jgi:hypothetical protein